MTGMYEHKLARPLTCGVGITMEIIGGKWKTCLLYSIEQGLRRPSQLHRSNPGATPRVLNQQLRELEADGIVGKVVHAGLPLKVEYFLTPMGESLLPLISAIGQWGDEHGADFRQILANRQDNDLTAPHSN
jgi:DNA-binding HxlR family transcriptional regulator